MMVLDTLIRDCEAGEVSFDGTSYEALKQRVHHLKRVHQKAVQTNKSVKELESVALLQQRQHYESQIAELVDEVAALQAQLRQNTERSAKLRVHHERNKKALQAQAERLAKELEGRDAEHEAALCRQRAAHEAAVSQSTQELELLQQGRAEDRRAFELARQEAIDEVDQWCQGEIEAVRHALTKQLQDEQEQTEAWKRKCADREALVLEAQLRADEAEGRAAQLQERVHCLDADAEALQLREQQAACSHDEQLSQVLQREEQAALIHQAEVQALKAAHRQQLELVDSRLHQLVARKDATVAALKAELQQVHERLRKFEGLLVAPASGR